MAIPNNPTQAQTVKAIKDLETNKADSSALSSYLPKSGGTMTGAVTLTSQSSIWNTANIKDTKGSTIGFNSSGQIGLAAVPDSSSLENAFTFRVGTTNKLRIGNTNMRPETTDSYGLGTASNQFNTVYGKTIYENGTSLASKYQATLPTTTTAGKVLKSTSTAGTVEWGDAGAAITSVNGLSGGTISSSTTINGDMISNYVKIASIGHETTSSYDKHLTLSSTNYVRYRTTAELKSDLNVPTKTSDLTNDSGFLTAAPTNMVTTDTAQTISALKTITAGLKVSGRPVGSGDDEGIVIGTASNNYAGVCCGSPSGRRAVFYLKPSASSGNSIWRYNSGSASYDIAHPEKSGTIALTSDIPTNIAIMDLSTQTGSFYATSFYASSDRRLKENIKPVELDCGKVIDDLQIKEFNFKADEDKKVVVGAIAQELQEILPEKYRAELVGGSEDTQYTINEGKLLFVAIGALKEEREKTKELEERLARLEELIKG